MSRNEALVVLAFARELLDWTDTELARKAPT
jgi:hypothetical protein